MDDVSERLSTLRVYRRGSRRLVEQEVGYGVEVPGMGLPEGSPPEGGESGAWLAEPESLLEVFDWSDPRRGGVDFRAVEAVNLRAPSAWEQFYLEWLSELLGAELTGVESGGGATGAAEGDSRDGIGARLTGGSVEPWRSAEAFRADGEAGDVQLRRADTARGEARAAAADVRSWLVGEDGVMPKDAAERLDGVLVLLPDEPSVTRLWRAEFERADLPVDSGTGRSLGESGGARWLTDVLRLAGWEDEPKPRPLLRRVFEGPYWSATKVTESLSADVPEQYRLRKALRETLRSIRGESVDLAVWRAQLRQRGSKSDGADSPDEVALEWTRRLVELVSRPGHIFRRLHAAVEGDGELDLGVKESLHSADGSASAEAVFGAITDALSELARREKAFGRGEEDETFAAMAAGDLRPAEVLADQFARRRVSGDGERAAEGVTLLPARLYDGRESDVLVIGGMGEGVYPSVPARWDHREVDWVEYLGLDEHFGGRDGESDYAAFVHHQIDRHARIVAEATDRCAGPVTYAYHVSGPTVSETPPGPILTLLVGGWRDDDWRSSEVEGESGRVDGVAWADEIPRSVADAPCLEAASLFACESPFDGWAEGAGSSGDAESDDTWGALSDRIQGIQYRLEPSLLEEEARREGELGPRTGVLPGGFDAPDSYSASALRNYGECPAQYFYGRGLGLEDGADAEYSMDAMETGSVIHDGFFKAAREQLDNGEEGAPWALVYDADEVNRETFVETVVETLAEHLEAVFMRVADEDPGLREPYEQARVERWRAAVEAWVDEHVREEMELSPERIEFSEEAVDEWLRSGHEERRGEIEAIWELNQEKLDAFESYLQESDGIRYYNEYDDFYHSDGYFTHDELESVTRRAKDEDSVAAGLERLAELREKAHQKYEEALDELQTDIEDGISDELDDRRSRINHHVVHVELAFRSSDERYGDASDPASLDHPVEIELPGDTTVTVSGMIDRVDHDAEAEAIAIRDYKSGGSKTKLAEEIASGEHVQLPLYAIAVEAATADGAWPKLEGSEVRFASLEKPKRGESEEVRLDARDLVDRGTGEGLDYREAIRRWTACYVEGIEGGCFAPTPREGQCPIENEYGAWCDYENLCAVKGDPLDAGRFAAGPSAPDIELDEESSSSSSDEAEPDWTIVPSMSRRADDKLLRADHETAGEAVRDLEQDVVVAAGAGTGKTYSLVLRYLEALADGRTPDEVLCVTFSRKAAAEMTLRIRRALLEGLCGEADSDDMQEVVDRIVDDQGRGRLRRTLFQLSGAPISTIDSLAGDILRAAEDLEEASGAGANYDIVSGGAAEEEVERFVLQRFYDGLEEGDERLDWLLGAITPDKLRQYLVEAVKNYSPRSKLSVDDLGKLEDELVDSWGQIGAYLEDEVWEGTLRDLAPTAARLVSVAAEWSEQLRERMKARGRLRYGDVLELATEKLTDDALVEGLAAEFPFRHIFVDELQDTSEGQVEMLERLADVAEQADGFDAPRQFWVGDRKQSIYQFRNADVDVFERRIEEARQGGDWTVGRLTENRRSRPELIRAINALFSRLHPAGWDAGEGESEDPGTEIRYEPLTWPEDVVKSARFEGPPVEVIAAPDKGWARNFDEYEDVDALLRDSVARRVGRLLEEADVQEREDDGAAVAVLVTRWSDAEDYGDALADYGIEAVIEGGNGLLERWEALVLRRWLEAALFPDRQTALVAALQGAGFGCSSTGLYCLRKGWGVDGADAAGRSLKAAILFGELEPEQAVDDWEEAVGGVDREAALEVLEKDAEVLERFQGAFGRFRRRLGFEPTADLLAELVERADMGAFWHAQDGGRQRVANIERFLDAVREIEEAGGIAPRRVHRELEQKAGDDDPASGGLAASRGADVVLTSYWQAKGREWPVVVLPEMHRTKVKLDNPVGPERLTLREGPDEPPEVVNTADIRVTDSDPFKTSKTDVTEDLIVPTRKRAARAENRRLLYVAMTRAEDKVVMAGQFQRYSNDDHDPVRLRHAKNWALSVYVAGGLVFEDGEPLLDPDGGWGDASGFEVDVRRPKDVPDYRPADREGRSLVESPDIDEIAAKAGHWKPVTSGVRTVESVSATEPPETVPEPDRTLERDVSARLPDSPFDDTGTAGDVFHHGMELWAFGEGRPDAEVWEEALDAHAVATEADRDPYIAYLDGLLDRTLAFDDLTDELRQARKRGDLYPELPVRFTRDGQDGDETLYRGFIDLVWRDADGRLHLLDYKTGHDPREYSGGLLEDKELRSHFSQVKTYRRGLEAQLGEELASWGLWFVKSGLVVGW